MPFLLVLLALLSTYARPLPPPARDYFRPSRLLCPQPLSIARGRRAGDEDAPPARIDTLRPASTRNDIISSTRIIDTPRPASTRSPRTTRIDSH